MKLNNLLSSVAEAGRDLLSGERKWFSPSKSADSTIEKLCEDLLSSKGEALGTALAVSVVDACRAMDDEDRFEFFNLLLIRFAALPESIDSAISAYQSDHSSARLYTLLQCSEAPRLELFRRINMAPGGTETLVSLRGHLIQLLKKHPEFIEIDGDLSHLMSSWFNRGFLRLERIDWRTPAFILEKLIAYEAVHAMDGWGDLQRRLAEDRRCFAFFHPAMDDEPLIFVQVALCEGLAGSVQQLLEAGIDAGLQKQADTAIFYSISDCQSGLKGISFGNFLIKQVVMELQSELPNLQHFATLSPIPGFCRWLKMQIEDKQLTEQQLAAIGGFNDPQQRERLKDSEEARIILMQLCAHYLFNAKRGEQPLDPVARFHLRNGASIERINWRGDISDKGIRQSAGIMVNYKYNLKRVEERHENFVNDNIVTVEKEFTKYINPVLLGD